MNSSLINYEVTSEKKLINELLDENIHVLQGLLPQTDI